MTRFNGKLETPRARKYAIAKNGTARIGKHGTERWVTEAYHVPLDRRGTPRTCYLVADKFGFGNCQTVAPPAVGGTREGSAVAPRGTVAAQSSQAFRRNSTEAAGPKPKIMAEAPPPFVDDSLAIKPYPILETD